MNKEHSSKDDNLVSHESTNSLKQQAHLNIRELSQDLAKDDPIPIKLTHSVKGSDTIPGVNLAQRELTDGEKLTLAHESQPHIVMPEKHYSESGELFELQNIYYSVQDTQQETHITYIYESNFSDTPGGLDLIWEDHAFDYEPVIAHINKSTGEVSYTFDKGHFSADTTNTQVLEITEGAHYFKPQSETPEQLKAIQFSSERFKPLTQQDYDRMNTRIEALKSTPWGKPLSLDWAVNHPDRVRETGYFSKDPSE